MGWVTDLLKEIPLSTILREKITVIEQKYAALETENAILKDDLRKAKANVVQLEGQVGNLNQEIEKLTHVGDDLDEVEVALLRALTNPDVAYAEQLAGMVGSNLTRVEYHLQRLVDAGYATSPLGVVPGASRYLLTHEGRECLIKRNSI